MPFDASGNFTRVMNWTNDYENGIEIVCDRHDSEDDNFAAVNNTVSTRLDALVSEIESANLTDKQRAMIADKVIESLKLGNNPSSWKKILMQKINIK